MKKEKGIAYHTLSKKEALESLKTSEKGISESEAKIRLKQYGKNELKQTNKVNPFLIFLEQFKSIFILILILAAIFSLVIKHYMDFSVVAVILLVNAAIGFIQQYKAEKTISSLKDMLIPTVKVIRDNKTKEISSVDLVPGDIILISEGDKIMADARVIESNELETNEAVLTGESESQIKNAEKISLNIEIQDRKNILYTGSSCIRGNCRAMVFATGMNTEFGKIVTIVQEIEPEQTPLQTKLDSFSKKVAIIISILTIITVIIGIYRGEVFYEMLLVGVSLAISVIPEGIPAVIAITLSLSIKRMQQKNALIRKLPAAETLGEVTVICTDKTGTLTKEEMTVVEIYSNKELIEVDNGHFKINHKPIEIKSRPGLYQLLKIGVVCNNAIIEKEKEVKVFGDATEKALVICADNAGIFKKELTEQEKRIIEYSFSSKRQLMSIVRKNDEIISYVKGSPEVILKKCSHELINGRIVSLNSKRKTEVYAAYEKMAGRALRVLGFAYKKLNSKITQENAEEGLIFVGLQGMIDPPRPEVKKAIEECKTAGIKVKMITGDSIMTAITVSEMISLKGGAIEGYALEKLSEEEFDYEVSQKTIFARITPEIKLRIIQSLKRQNEIIAVSGDGVNDILALKEAHIGIAMGKRGTAVARDTADIILLDDNFASIVSAVREGRRVYDNLKKSIKFHLSANLGELLVVMFAFMFAFPLPLLPLAILWMNLVTDSLPSIALGFEEEEKDIMKRKPKSPEESILKGIFSFILFAGLLSFLIIMGVFLFNYQTDLAKARTMALTTAVFFELFLVFACKFEDKTLGETGIFGNKFLLFSVIFAFILQIVAIYSPLSTVFEFKALSILELLTVTFVSSLGLVFFELMKPIKRKYNLHFK